MKNNFILLLCGLLLAVGQFASAQTPDGETPSEELICGEETGALKGLCNAYCEAMDCDLHEAIHGSPKACAKVLDNYLTKSGGDNPPCLDSGCAATAVAAANDFYAQCVTSGGCERLDSCPRGAQATYGIQLKKCLTQCSTECGVETKSCFASADAVYQTCLSEAGHDSGALLECENARQVAYSECKVANTSCTDACTGPAEPYVPPSSCP